MSASGAVLSGRRARGAGAPREYQLPIVRELYPSWHPLAGRVIDTASADARAPRLRLAISRGAAAPRP